LLQREKMSAWYYSRESNLLAMTKVWPEG